MVNEDSIKLLKECDAGIKTGITSIEEVMKDVKESKLEELLRDSIETHRILMQKSESLLKKYGEHGKDPGAMVKTMSWIKTNIKLAADNSDATIADLISEGCSMGIRTVSRYMNQYHKADTEAMDIAKNLRDIEEELEISLRDYL